MITDVALSAETLSRFALRDFLVTARADAMFHEIQRGDVLSRPQDTAGSLTVLHAGVCTAVKSLPDGQQQTVAIYVPGDIVDHERFTLGALRSTPVALGPVAFYRLQQARLRDAMAADPALAAAFCSYIAFQGALAQEWMLSLGRRPAYERTAHLLCEIVYRMRIAGLGSEFGCPFPLTQHELADTLGLSVVHINRTLQRLRQEGFIALDRTRLEILRRSDLVSLAGFDTSYLTLVGGE